MLSSASRHLRRNLVAYLALLFTLSGTSYAAATTLLPSSPSPCLLRPAREGRRTESSGLTTTPLIARLRRRQSARLARALVPPQPLRPAAHRSRGRSRTRRTRRVVESASLPRAGAAAPRPWCGLALAYAGFTFRCRLVSPSWPRGRRSVDLAGASSNDLSAGRK